MSNYAVRWVARAPSSAVVARLLAVGTLTAFAFAAGAGFASAQDGKSFPTVNIVGTMTLYKDGKYVIGANAAVTEHISGTQTIKINKFTGILRKQVKEKGKTIWQEIGGAKKFELGKALSFTPMYTIGLWEEIPKATDVFQIVATMEYDVLDAGGRTIRSETRIDTSNLITKPPAPK